MAAPPSTTSATQRTKSGEWLTNSGSSTSRSVDIARARLRGLIITPQTLSSILAALRHPHQGNSSVVVVVVVVVLKQQSELDILTCRALYSHEYSYRCLHLSTCVLTRCRRPSSGSVVCSRPACTASSTTQATGSTATTSCT